MSSTTALIAIGEMHPNDGQISPSHLAQLHEGSRAVWTLHELSDRPAPRIIWRPDQPNTITTTLLAMLGARLLGHPVVDERFMATSVNIEPEDRAELDRLATATREADRFGVVATVFDGSSLDITELKALTNLDVQIANITYSRVWSAWTSAWKVTE